MLIPGQDPITTIDAQAIGIPFWLESIAIIAGAIAGALRAIREQLAISGVVALVIALGLGGGLIRDTLLQVGTPVAISDSRFLPIALSACVPAMILMPVLGRVEWAVFATDSLAIGLYSVLGADKALLHGVPPVGALVVGVLAGTGGSLLADLIVGVPPVLFRPGILLGVASAMGTLVYIIGLQLSDARAAWFVISVIVITGTRLVSAATGRGVGPAGRFIERMPRPVVRRRPSAQRNDTDTRERTRRGPVLGWRPRRSPDSDPGRSVIKRHDDGR